MLAKESVVFLLQVSTVALRITSLSPPLFPHSIVPTGVMTPIYFVCPHRAAVCTWTVDRGWREIWHAPPALDRGGFQVTNFGRGMGTIFEPAMFGAFVTTLIDSHVAGESVIYFLSSPQANLGSDAVSLIVCSGSQPISCATRFFPVNSFPTTGPSHELPEHCLFPRHVAGQTLCLEQLNEFDIPTAPMRLKLRIVDESGTSDEQRITLPPGVLQDFAMRPGEAWVLFQDGRLFRIRGGRPEEVPTRRGTWSLSRLYTVANRVFLVTVAVSEKSSAFTVALIDEKGVREVLTHEGVLMGLAEAGPDSVILHIETEDQRAGRLLRLWVVAPPWRSEVLWSDKP
jgi:hypothetical protein